MAWPTWKAGALPLESAAFPTLSWSHLVAALPALSRKVRLALPCIGLDALGNGFLEMGWDNFEVLYAHDVDLALRGPLTALHGPCVARNFRLGKPEGDILKVDFTLWDRVDMVVSGPPCPPWSAIGRRQGAADWREAVFAQVTNIIVDQAHRGCYAFVLEMVPGIDDRRPGGRESYLAEWLHDLSARAPMLRVFPWVMNCSEYLPQHRIRFYIVGVHWPLVQGTPLPPRLPPCAAASRASLRDVLHVGLPPCDEGRLQPALRRNLRAWKRIAAPYGRRDSGLVAILSVDRDPDMRFGSLNRYDGLAPALRTHNELLWVYILDRHGMPLVSRCLHPVERLALQGFRPEVADFLSKSALLRLSGNAFSVPVVTAVVRECLMLLAAPRVLGVPNVDLVVNAWLSDCELEAHSRKRRRLNLARCKLAVIERQVAILTRRAKDAGHEEELLH